MSEHEELHAALVRATKVKGRIGAAAREVATLLHPHFVAEEEYALPPLGLLRALAEGPVTAEMKDVLLMTDRLRADLPKMLAEHQAIVGALRREADPARTDRGAGPLPGRDPRRRVGEGAVVTGLGAPGVLHIAAVIAIGLLVPA